MVETRLPSALIFDWDNTLVDTWGIIQDALNTTLEAFGKTPWTLEEIHTKVRKSARDSFPGLFGDRWEEASHVFYKRYAEIHMVKLEQRNGAKDMLERLSSLGFYMAVVSNKRGDYLRAEADHLNWSRFFTKIVGANDTERDKPSPEPIHLALSETEIMPGPDVWYIGDSDIDMDFAHRVGCYPVLMRERLPGDGEFGDFPPASHFPDCMALCKFIDNL